MVAYHGTLLTLAEASRQSGIATATRADYPGLNMLFSAFERIPVNPTPLSSTMFSLKNDLWIAARSSVLNLEDRLITPFTPGKIRKLADGDGSDFKCVSFGLSSFGYDLSLSGDDFQIFHRVPGLIMDPHKNNGEHLVTTSAGIDHGQEYFILPAHSYALGVVKEKLNMPEDVLGICIGKSTYARLGIICNMTPVEPGWRGHLTIELSNSSDSDCKIYANEGICQIIFFQGDTCAEPYGEGKYQDQKQEVTHAKV